jgi:hypothetical protein
MALMLRSMQSILFAFFLFVWPCRTRAEVYQWVDKNGTVHVTDRIEDLPEPYYSRALKELKEKETLEKAFPKQNPAPSQGSMQKQTSGETTVIAPERIPKDVPQKTPEQLPTPEEQKQHWQEKLKTARERVSELDVRCKKLETDRDIHVQNSLLFARPIDRELAASNTTSFEECNKELVAARNYLEKELPEEARKAGVPPGWLRE